VRLKRERARETFHREGGSSESNSFRAPRVLRAWERGELFFPAKKEQGSNNTVLQQKARAPRRGRGCDHPDEDRRRRTESGFSGSEGVDFTRMAITRLQGR